MSAKFCKHEEKKNSSEKRTKVRTLLRKQAISVEKGQLRGKKGRSEEKGQYIGKRKRVSKKKQGK